MNTRLERNPLSDPSRFNYLHQAARGAGTALRCLALGSHEEATESASGDDAICELFLPPVSDDGRAFRTRAKMSGVL
jgi:hypothetical protein